MQDGSKLAVEGATGRVGRHVVEILNGSSRRPEPPSERIGRVSVY